MVLLVSFDAPIYIIFTICLKPDTPLSLYLLFQVSQIIFLNEVLHFSVHGWVLEINKFVLDYLWLVGSLLEPFHFLKSIQLLVFKLAKLHNVRNILNWKVLSDVRESKSEKLLVVLLRFFVKIWRFYVNTRWVWPIKSIIDSCFRVFLDNQRLLLNDLCRNWIIAL